MNNISLDDLGKAPPAAAVDSTPRWMISMADLLSLILAFFVLIFSLANPYQQISEYENSKETTVSVEKTVIDHKVKLARSDDNLSTTYLFNVITQKANRDDDLRKLKYVNEGETILVSMNDNEWSDIFAQKLASMLRTISNETRIYTGKLDYSHEVLSNMKQYDLNKDIAFFESSEHKGKIDIIIYP